jgi:hypothetical protein
VALVDGFVLLITKVTQLDSCSTRATIKRFVCNPVGLRTVPGSISVRKYRFFIERVCSL